jgi:Mg2+-importing ATPase
MIPADLRVFTAKDLFLNEAVLTGEAMPVEKSAAPFESRDARRPTRRISASWAATS